MRSSLENQEMKWMCLIWVFLRGQIPLASSSYKLSLLGIPEGEGGELRTSLIYVAEDFFERHKYGIPEVSNSFG
jgi:hypothetical protein